MAARLSTEDEIARMRNAGRLAASVLERIGEHVAPGVTTGALNDICHAMIVDELGCIPAPLNYTNAPGQPPFPEVRVYLGESRGLPRHPDRPQDAQKRRHPQHRRHRDQGWLPWRHFENVLRRHPLPCWRSAWSGSPRSVCIEGSKLSAPVHDSGDIGHAIQSHAEANNFAVVREFCGHGIGRVFHDEPQVVHYGRAGTGMRLEEGMTFTIEPMINAGKRHVKILPDHWTVVTKDHKLSAQWEHTILVTGTGAEVLTLRSDEQIG